MYCGAGLGKEGREEKIMVSRKVTQSFPHEALKNQSSWGKGVTETARQAAGPSRQNKVKKS